MIRKLAAPVIVALLLAAIPTLAQSPTGSWQVDAYPVDAAGHPAATTVKVPFSGVPIAPAQIPAPTASTLGGVKSATAPASQMQTGIDTGGNPTFAVLPSPGASALGGVKSATAPSNNFQTGIDTGGNPTFAQPSATNVSGLASIATSGNAADLSAGTILPARMPALTGSCTTTVNTVAVTCEQDGAWTTYTPTVTGAPTGGCPTNCTVNTSRSKLIGTKTYSVLIDYTVTTATGGSGSPTFTIPTGSATANFPCFGVNTSTGTAFLAYVAANIIASNIGTLAANHYLIQCTYEIS